MAQEPLDHGGAPQKPITPTKEELSAVAAKVDVTPVTQDEDIRKRLQTVLNATDWFTDPQVRVEEGVVFINGQEARPLKDAENLLPVTSDTAISEKRTKETRP
ncbi:hypothetical protein [Thiocapsa imhoffii]|uniref:hypothetical protein n=1 Tax=Thiocapsa imhoffii TaxID=382777 RepID=UPI001F5B4264|nr:hypothetical protein [Thiocapsa imhoffii]